MADRRLLVWQLSLSAVVTTAFGLMTGFSLPVARSANLRSFIPITLPVRSLQLNPNTSEVEPLTAQPNEAYQKVIAKLAAEEKARRLNFSVPVQFQGKTINDVQLKGGQKTSDQGTPRQPIALTFDDGPWPNTTSQILNILKQHNVKATFFVVGKHVQQYPQLTKQIVTDGHAIGNHTWSHQYHQFSPAAATRELDNLNAILHKTTGVKTSLFRPPAGILDNGLVATAHQKKYAVIMWSVDSIDWRARHMTQQAFIQNMLKQVKPGGIILLHDGGGDRTKTVQALPQLITELKKRGYQFVTVPQLLEMEAGG